MKTVFAIVALMLISAAAYGITFSALTGETVVEIIYLGEGESGPVSPGYACEDGLVPISCDVPGDRAECDFGSCTDTFHCTDCGNDICMEPENRCNCPHDCGVVAPGNIFVTNQTFTGNIGGLSGADKKCQEAAGCAGYRGTWIALLSTETIYAGERLPKTEFVNMDGKRVAKNHIDISDGSLINPILNEYGEETKHVAWTGSYAYPFLIYTEIACNDWTSSAESIRGTAGNANMTNFEWMEWNYVQSCAKKASLYCIRAGG